MKKFVLPPLKRTWLQQRKAAVIGALREQETRDPNRMRLRPRLFSWEQENDR